MVSLTSGISQYQRKKTFYLNMLITRTGDENMKETKL